MINIFQRNYTKKELKFIEFLKKTELFQDFSNKEIVTIMPAFHSRTYDQGEDVFFQGDKGLSVYLIRSGSIALFLSIDTHLEEMERKNVGESFGENALIDGSQRLFNAQATEESELYVIPTEQLNDILESKPMIGWKLMKNLGKLYHQNQVDIIEAYQKDFAFFELKNVFEKN